MPIYIDYHQLEGDFTIEDVRQAHRADLSNQEKHGVRYLQFWVNQKAGTVFCLMEGPDPEACQACHLESHGNTPCNIQEVEPGFFKLFMGERLPTDDYHMTLDEDGKADLGNRTILLVDIQRKNTIHGSKGYQPLLRPVQSRNLVMVSISRFNGRVVEQFLPDSLIGVFNSPINAIRCVRNIHPQLLRLAGDEEESIDFRMALNNGPPLTKENGFFEAAIKQASWLTITAGPNQIVLSAYLKNLFDLESEASLSPHLPFLVKVLTTAEEEFVYELFNHIEVNLSEESFNVTALCRIMGISRPQLYRKTTVATGHSPIDLIKILRMKRAWKLLKVKQHNVSEIALEVGYSSPSYFSKIFHDSFGYTPSQLYANNI